ncbi:MAG: tetratricopeptide repeat protein [Opitutales bacterium]
MTAPSESRTYRLAKAALLAVLVAITPAPSALRAQAAGNVVAGAKSEGDAVAELFKDAEKLFDAKKYREALEKYVEVEKKSDQAQDMYKAVISFRKGSCYYFMKDWPRTEKEFTDFLAKYPKGTEDFFDSDNRRGVAELTLIESFSSQGKWDAALTRLEKIRNSITERPEVRVNAFALSAKISVDRAKSGDEAAKKAGYSQAVTFLQQAIAEGVSTPERREAAIQLVEIYTKLGLVKEAEQLKARVDANKSGSPADLIRSNFQLLSIGDARFTSADSAVDEIARGTLYRQALASYQGTMRATAVTRDLGKGMAAKEETLEALTKANPKPNDEMKVRIEQARVDLESFKKIDAEFKANKDYDAIISYRIGLCLLELGRPWEAFVAFKDIFERSPGFTRITGAYYYYVITLRQMGRREEAQKVCKDFLKKFPKADEVSPIAIILGEISQDNEDYKEAIEHYKWARANVPNLTPDAAMEIDFRIAACLFSQYEWDEARKAFDAFSAKYERSPVRQQVLYMTALCWFYQGKYKETKEGFDKYQGEYPKGLFIPDVRYRQAIVRFGVQPPETEETIKLCEEWLKDYGADKSDEIQVQLPDVHTLVGDANIRLAEGFDKAIREADLVIRAAQSPAARAKAQEEKARLDKLKSGFTDKAIEAYITAAKLGQRNANALEFVLRELNKMLPGRGEHRRMRELYMELYNWDTKDPKALTYLYEVIRATERMGDRKEFAERSEEIQKKFSAELAKARLKVDQLERANPPVQATIDAAKGEVKALSGKLAEELAAVEKERQASIARAKDNALKILSDAVAENINDRRQEGAEKLIGFLAEKVAKKVRRVRPGAQPEPGAYTSADAEKEITRLLRLDQNKDSLVAQARGYYALGQLAVYTREPAKTELNFSKIAANYKPEELSPTILAVVGDHLLEKGDLAKADAYFAAILTVARSSEYADYGYAGQAEILLRGKKFKEAMALCDEAIEARALMSKELNIMFIRAQCLAETQKYDEAKKGFEEIAKTKEWRGEKTAGSLYWLGLIEERQGRLNEAVAFYRRCYQGWRKYEGWSAKAYLGCAKMLIKLNQRPDAKVLLTEMLSKDRIKETPEANEARKLSLSL